MKRALIALGATALVVGGTGGFFALADTAGTSSASCGAANAATGTAPCTGTWSVDVPVPTVTQTVPGPTTTVTQTVTQTVTVTPPPPPPAQTLNCLPSPHLCGFPDATNTGVPSNVTLAPYTGPTTINTAGTVIDGADIHGPVVVNAANVTIKNSRIYLNSSNVSGQNVALWVKPTGTNFSASHDEVTGNLNGQSYCISAIANDSTGAKFDTINAHDCGDGVRGGDLTMTNSYLHNFWFGQINGQNVDTPHADCWQGMYGDSNVTLDHNTCNNPNSAPPPGSPGYSNAVLQLGTEGSNPASNWTLKNSLAQGGGLSVNMRQTPITGITITGNQWGRDNAYGLIGSNTGNSYSWSGNVWDDTGATALPQPG